MYLALYRKYRPKTFEDVISQPHITTTLKNEVISGKTAHAYLFTGPRGTGKTTCSKILSMAVNCEHPVDGNPCLVCEACRGIEEGSNLDVVEIDAASNNGVDNIRQLRDEANYTPSQCRYRVYIIDETHMLSTGAFNALLKIMEEPPEHVKFILATTEAHKVPATILSRCQRFDFRRIRPEDIRDRLLSIVQEEPFTLTPDAAELIARLADGGMRDAFSLLDQCAAFSDEITLDTVAQAAGVVGRDYLYELTECILRQDAGGAVSVVDRLYSMSKDMQGLLEEMIYQFRNLMLVMTLRQTDGLVNVLPDEMEHLKSYAKQLPLSAVLMCISNLQECLDKMSRSFDKRLTLELCFVKLCTPAMGQSVEELTVRLDRIEAALRAGEFAPVGVSAAKSGKPLPPAADTTAPDGKPSPLKQVAKSNGRKEASPTPTMPDKAVPGVITAESTITKPTESKPTESKPTESKPTESKPTESKPTESKPTVLEPTVSKSNVSEPVISDSFEPELVASEQLMFGLPVPKHSAPEQPVSEQPAHKRPLPEQLLAEMIPPEVTPPEELLPWKSEKAEVVETAEAEQLESKPLMPDNEAAVEVPIEPEWMEPPEGLPQLVAEAPIQDSLESMDSGSVRDEEVPVEELIERAAPPGFEETAQNVETFGDSTEIRPLQEWAEVLLELSKIDPPLYGVLRDSRGFTQDGVLYIDSALSITAMMMRQEGNAAKLMTAVESKTGSRYKIRVKSAQPISAPKADVLSTLLEQARAAGVVVREE